MTPLAHRSLLSFALLVAVTSACSTNKNKTRPAAPTGSTVTSQEMERSQGPGDPIEKYLSGRVSGVTVTRAGDGISVRIRGGGSTVNGGEPLYLIDGVPVQAGPQGELSGMNPYDIESIRVLKDPADTAAYGMRGSNGVIIIKPKRTGR